jgi:hypothetical protein
MVVGLRVLGKVKSLSPNYRFVIALHSPAGIIKTGLPLCPPKKKARKLACKFGGTFSLVRTEGESRVIAAISRDS